MKRNENEDCRGVQLIGYDEEKGNWWYGTPNAWCVIGDADTSGCDEHGVPDGSCDGPCSPPVTPTYFEVAGWRWGGEFSGYFIASNEETLRQWLASHDVKDYQLISKRIKTRRKLRPYGVLDLTDEQAAKLLDGSSNRPIVHRTAPGWPAPSA